MWVVTGPFDGEISNEVGFQKSKLLKSGKSYVIGRKSTCDLVVNHKKVSHDHGQFIVEGFSPDDVTNVDYKPTLRILNSKNKTMRIWREGVVDGVIVNPAASEPLQHDDKVDIVSGLPLTVQWLKICCFETPGKVRTPISIDGCASLGVHVVRTLHPDITHHLVPSYAFTPGHMISLLSAAQLVKPEWLSELIALSTLDPQESTRALEHNFLCRPKATRLNMLKGYRFVFVGEKGVEIPAEYESFTVSTGIVRWRKALFRAKTLAEEKNAKVSPWKEFISIAKSLDVEFIQPENILQAIASVDTYFVDSAHPVDTQAQSSREASLPDVVPNTFPGEPSIPPSLSGSHPRAPSPPTTSAERLPPTATSLPEPPGPEPEIVELPPRRAGGQNRTAPSPGPGDNGAIVPASPTPAPPPALNLGDDALAATQLPTPVSQTRRPPPRRRANLGIDASSALISAASSSNPQTSHTHFSQLDRYKALFDASDPDREPLSGEIDPGTGASTQGARTGTLSTVPEDEQQASRVQSSDLRGTKRSRGAENGDDGDVAMLDSTADVAGSGAGTLEGVHRPKRRALGANTVSPPAAGAPAAVPVSQSRSAQTQGQGKGPTSAGAKPTSKSAAAASNHHHRKKNEDNFDREFNQLRITKPRNVNVDTIRGRRRSWDTIDDFGDIGIRGNFMVVVEMDIQRGASAKYAPPARDDDLAHPEWIGKPNFKKFKTKSTAPIERRPTVELVISEENDYGIGNAYWRGAASGSRSDSDTNDITVAHPPGVHRYSKSKADPASKASRATANSRGGRARAPPTGEDEDDDEDDGVVTVEGLDLEAADEMEIDEPVAPRTTKPLSTRSKAAKTTAKGKGKAKASPARTKKKAAPVGQKKLALFLSDDDDDDDELLAEVEDEVDEVVDEGEGESAAAVALALGADVSEENGLTSTLRSTAGTQLRREAVRATTKKRAAALVEADDDSDDDAVFKGFGARKRGKVR
ncbi:hypothetical protein BGY98DRAFT_987158 [Russula aff. rugulosa BPL654]|nr:hypothetical protein BGY98DRAFT_987158 [Russula aff. rugulosa BPL654]